MAKRLVLSVFLLEDGSLDIVIPVPVPMHAQAAFAAAVCCAYMRNGVTMESILAEIGNTTIGNISTVAAPLVLHGGGEG